MLRQEDKYKLINDILGGIFILAILALVMFRGPSCCRECNELRDLSHTENIGNPNDS